ncbi:hypothetical protein Srubr_67760 [Streptomyces rubradiris]|uniref:Uncharacterized protein n=1 Tax=Streptomyces rubradiris TaxID=285531 RepID=A0ABQ3RM42_STRRR|nr:hypothetical protein GCM10018792_21310 [Streptomyces rubradiris]GHI56930.1 hypothetical protein Srubr_67760 [Streptomyces rubradiris]
MQIRARAQEVPGPGEEGVDVFGEVPVIRSHAGNFRREPLPKPAAPLPPRRSRRAAPAAPGRTGVAGTPEPPEDTAFACGGVAARRPEGAVVGTAPR